MQIPTRLQQVLVLSPAYNRQFVVGNSFFRRNWVTEPSSTADLDGLGPLFNARSCGSCHFKDGRAAPPLSPSDQSAGLLFRLSKPSGIEWEQLPDSHYGFQLNPNAIFGLEGEGIVSVSYEEQPGQYDDGETYSLRKPIYTFQNLAYGDLDPDIRVSPRIAPHMVGLGLLEAISESTLMGWEDINDVDGDGISGKLNYVWNIEEDREVVGRFGWKANQPNVRQQVASAFLGDIGITSSIFPIEACGPDQTACEESIVIDDVELTDDILDRVTLYSAALGVPRRRDWDEPEVIQGKSLFVDMNCNGCHKLKTTTETNNDIPEYSNITIRPYTDLLLHDMGEGLADNAPDHRANGREWRTPPLWGIGMFRVVNNHTNYLHDGRARNLEEAVLWHGGEAAESRRKFKSLNKEERDALIAFLESL
ncbi:MAG: di-heme oxidoredictase family protein [Bacteroidota bacterium]